MQTRSKQDALINNIIIGISIVVFLIGALQGMFVGLVAGVIVGGFLFIMWCVFFHEPTTRARIILGVIFIPLYLLYPFYIWVAFPK